MSTPPEPQLDLGEDAPAGPPAARESPARAFGVDNRRRLLEDYFAAAAPVTAASAWEHAYRLLLWIDRTTGLAHCYESDKCQPGRPWYARSLAFHIWLADAFDVGPGDLAEKVDRLFHKVTVDLAATAAAARPARLAAAREQRAPYGEVGLPQPGEDPELEEIITTTLAAHLSSDPAPEVLRDLTERIQTHVGQENKRKNLVGEGFEDTLAALLARIPTVAAAQEIHVRPNLRDLPDFGNDRAGAKARQVDLALVHRTTKVRTLVSCKWSVRSDREEQFASDFGDYVRQNDGDVFRYVLVTNEFDPARLAAACDMRSGNSPLFTDVVHVNTEGVAAAYAAPGAGPVRGKGGQVKALAHIESRRLASLGTWAASLA